VWGVGGVWVGVWGWVVEGGGVGMRGIGLYFLGGLLRERYKAAGKRLFLFDYDVSVFFFVRGVGIDVCVCVFCG